MQQIAASGVLYPFGLARGSRRVKQKKRVFRIHPFGLAGGGLGIHDLVQPYVAPGIESRFASGAAKHDDAAYGVATAHAQGFVHDGLEGQALATATLFVGRDDQHGTGVLDAVLQALGRETAKNHGVGRTDAGAGLHRDHPFHRHRQVDDHAVTLFHALCPQRIGQLADFVEQLPIGMGADAPIVGFEDDRHLVAQPGLYMPIQTVVGSIELSIFEPAVKRRMTFVQRDGERFFPGQEISRLPGPKTRMVGLSLSAQFVISQSTGDVRLSGERFRNRHGIGQRGKVGLVGASHLKYSACCGASGASVRQACATGQARPQGNHALNFRIRFYVVSLRTLYMSKQAAKLGVLPNLIFASRWLQLPLYIGLILAQAVYVYHFWVELAHLIEAAMGNQEALQAILSATGQKASETIPLALTETTIMLVVLGLIDVVMISNLLIMVIVGGYETFVSRMNLEGHPDQPEWLSHVNASVLKVKLATAIIGISSIHLLKTFINAANYTDRVLIAQTVIHAVFLLSAIAIALTDKLLQANHPPASP